VVRGEVIDTYVSARRPGWVARPVSFPAARSHLDPTFAGALIARDFSLLPCNSTLPSYWTESWHNDQDSSDLVAPVGHGGQDYGNRLPFSGRT